MRRMLGRALDWRFGAVVARLDALAVRTERLEELLEGRTQPMLRAIFDQETENRRRLFAVRDSPDYARPFDEPDPLVSVTIATRDRVELLLGRALPSLLGQSHTNLEVIVVGDGAEPEVEAALAGVDDARIRYANLSQRTVADEDPKRHWLVGSTIPRNEAARMARGQWLLHFDDDDELRPGAIASLLELARRARAEVAYGGFAAHRAGGEVDEELVFPPRWGSFGWQGALVHAGLRFFERELGAGQIGLPGDMYLLERMLRVGVRFAMHDGLIWDYYPSGVGASFSA